MVASTSGAMTVRFKALKGFEYDLETCFWDIAGLQIAKPRSFVTIQGSFPVLLRYIMNNNTYVVFDIMQN